MPDSIVTIIIYLFAAFGAFSLLKLIAGSIGGNSDEETADSAAPVSVPERTAPVQYDSDELAAVAAAAISAFEEETCCNPLVRNAFD